MKVCVCVVVFSVCLVSFDTRAIGCCAFVLLSQSTFLCAFQIYNSAHAFGGSRSVSVVSVFFRCVPCFCFLGLMKPIAAPPRDPDYPALLVLKAIYGESSTTELLGDANPSSMHETVLLEKVASSIKSFSIPFRNGSLFGAQVVCTGLQLLMPCAYQLLKMAIHIRDNSKMPLFTQFRNGPG